ATVGSEGRSGGHQGADVIGPSLSTRTRAHAGAALPGRNRAAASSLFQPAIAAARLVARGNAGDRGSPRSRFRTVHARRPCRIAFSADKSGGGCRRGRGPRAADGRLDYRSRSTHGRLTRGGQASDTLFASRV